MIKDEMFSIPIFSTSLEQDNESISSYCKLQRKKYTQGNFISNSGGWQSYPFQDIPEELADLFSSITNFSEKVCESMGILPVKLSNGWININGYKDFNWTHSHADSVLSGVYYVNTPEHCGNLIFEHPSIDSMEISLSPEKINSFNKFNTIGWMKRAESGVLCIFPGWVNHKVTPNMNEREERISISFNFI